MAVDQTHCPHIDGGGPGLLANIQNFQSAGTASSQAHIPIFVVTPSVLRTITNSTHDLPLVSTANMVFNTFATLVQNFVDNIPPQEREKIHKLQDSVSVVLKKNFTLSQNSDKIVELAECIKQLNIRYQ